MNIINQNTQNRILLVEDHAANAMVASLFLEQYGYSYDIVQSGEDAIEKVRVGGYSAILMDVRLEGIDGLEATRQIRQLEMDSRISRTPIIGMTALALQGDKERCLAVGMDDYISKPFNPLELEKKLMTFTSMKEKAA